MIKLKHKPVTLWVSLCTLGIVILYGIGYFMYAIVASIFALRDAGVAIIIGAPILLIWILEILVYVVLAIVLLVAVYRWSKTAIIISVFFNPIALCLILVFTLNMIGISSISFSNTAGIGELLFIAMSPLVMGVIAYNDIRYRLPKIRAYL